jgi:hypothetical protein
MFPCCYVSWHVKETHEYERKYFVGKIQHFLCCDPPASSLDDSASGVVRPLVGESRVFPYQYHSTVALHIHISSGGWRISPLVATVQRHTLTPLTCTIIWLPTLLMLAIGFILLQFHPHLSLIIHFSYFNLNVFLSSPLSSKWFPDKNCVCILCTTHCSLIESYRFTTITIIGDFTNHESPLYIIS